MSTDRHIEQRLALLLRPGPRHARPADPDTDDEEGHRANDTDPADEDPADEDPADLVDEGLAAGEASDPGAGRVGWRSRWGGRFERPQLMVIVCMVVIGLALSGWAVLRARPVEVVDDPVAPSTAPSGATDPTGQPTVLGDRTAVPSAAAPVIKVHVLGRVRDPGVHELPEGSRIEDALAAAGGVTGVGELGDLNLAQPLIDGQQIFVARSGKRTEVREPGTDSDAGDTSRAPPGDAPTTEVVNLNTADQEELDQLPGVGPVTAAKILSWRETHGRFSSVAELQEVDGIGPKTFAELEPLVTV